MSATTAHKQLVALYIPSWSFTINQFTTLRAIPTSGGNSESVVSQCDTYPKGVWLMLMLFLSCDPFHSLTVTTNFFYSSDSVDQAGKWALVNFKWNVLTLCEMVSCRGGGALLEHVDVVVTSDAGYTSTLHVNIWFPCIKKGCPPVLESLKPV